MTHPSIYPSIAHPILAYVFDKKDAVLLFFSNDDDDDDDDDGNEVHLSIHSSIHSSSSVASTSISVE